MSVRRIHGGTQDQRFDPQNQRLARGDVAVELPSLALPLQLFVLGVVISMWDAQTAAAAGA